jgi:hypothetical protein
MMNQHLRSWFSSTKPIFSVSLPPYKAAPSQPLSTIDPSTTDQLVHGSTPSSAPPSRLPWLFSGLSLILQVPCLSVKKEKKKKKKKKKKKPKLPTFLLAFKVLPKTHAHFSPQLAHFLWPIDSPTFLLAFEVLLKTHVHFSPQLARFLSPIDSPTFLLAFEVFLKTHAHFSP